MTGARGFLIVAIVVILALSGLQYALRSNYKDRNYELFTEMVYSKAGESFTPSDVLPGRTTQQGLVPGVVPRGPLPLYYGTGEEEALRAGRELTNPFAADDAVALGRGRELFATYCTPCHGPGGNGDGVVVRRGMLPPPSLFARPRGTDAGRRDVPHAHLRAGEHGLLRGPIESSGALAGDPARAKPPVGKAAMTSRYAPLTPRGA